MWLDRRDLPGRARAGTEEQQGEGQCSISTEEKGGSRVSVKGTATISPESHKCVSSEYHLESHAPRGFPGQPFSAGVSSVHVTCKACLQ